MDPQRLADIVNWLGFATFVSWLLQLAAARIAARCPDPSTLRRIAGSRSWPAAANSLFVAWLTALGIELALIGLTERTTFIGTTWFIIALALLVGRLIDLVRDRADR